MGVGYDFVNLDKKEYFNPTMDGGYLRRRQIFNYPLNLIALETLVFRILSEHDPEMDDEYLNRWHGDKLLVLSDFDWTLPGQKPHENGNPNYFPIEEYTDITEGLCLYLIENNLEFAETYIGGLYMDSKMFVNLANLHYRIRNKSVEDLIINRFGEDWEKKYKSSFKNSKRTK